VTLKTTKTALVMMLYIAIGVSGLATFSTSEGAMSEGTEAKVKYTNRLKFEKSPYLLQHADNPVDWYPWGQEAFDKALKEDKPIFLSIGYSTCHWCHVMEHESFEDPEVARLMNEAFVSIKVDREERPDIDEIYMKVSQMLTGSGGWPLTIIMTPDRKPFFAATYIPKNTRFGRMGMLDLIPRIKEVWEKQREEVLNSAVQIIDALQQNSQHAPQQELDESVLKQAYEQLSSLYDEKDGGFGSSPKFPSPHNFLFLLRYWKQTGNERALEMVEKTLQSMRRGGIFDQVGFGFHRYSTDSKWLVPHFEKMLYDQAMLAMAYTETYQATGNEEYKRAAKEIFTYVLRDMTSPEGGFYSAEDADSEGVEGKYYLWTYKEIHEVLGSEEADFITHVFNIEREGNYTEEAAGETVSANILHLNKPIEEMASSLNLSQADFVKRLEDARQKLFLHREKRIHPFKDDKILADWNGLMIAALAKSARAFDEPGYTAAARRAVDFILKKMSTNDGRLFHRYRTGEAAVTAYLDDYAFVIWGLIELYETTFDVNYLQTALNLNKDLLEHFWDGQNGGFYSTADDGESLLVRQKRIYDGAVPSGNSVAMLNLLRLGRITADGALEEKASKTEHAFSREVKQGPAAYTQFLIGVHFRIGPSYEVVIAGDSDGRDTKAMLKTLYQSFIPNKIVILRPAEQKSPKIDRISEFIKYQSSIDGKATAYVCLNYKCKLPTTDTRKMLSLLNSE
jgi:hypothetical protein